MTVQMPKVPDPVTSTPVRIDAIAPPLAPLAMPKQILTPEHGLLRRMFGALAARVMLMRHSLRRAD